MRSIALGLIKVYRYAISPMMASHCRFYPSCSCYAQEAIEEHGLLKGSLLSAIAAGYFFTQIPGGALAQFDTGHCMAGRGQPAQIRRLAA